LESKSLELHFKEHIVDCWFPRCVDVRQGGFHQNFAFDWRQLPDTQRTIVFQSRMTWLSALAGLVETATHGVDYLQKHFWDQEHGGYFWSVLPNGEVVDSEKHSYGQAFAIFALCQCGRLTEADWAFQWFDLHARDNVRGGYFETLWSSGEPKIACESEADSIGTPYGLKSMNTHLHILEALIELYRHRRDATVRKRLCEVFGLLRDRFVSPEGKLWYYLTLDWVVASTVESYGHALETAFLLIEAAEILEIEVDATWDLAKKMVDHCLRVGWDFQFSGFHYEGHHEQKPSLIYKEWWTQAEAFNVLRIFANRFGEPYQSLMQKQWQFIHDFQIDHQHSGWRGRVSADGTADESQDKSDAWTESYHQARAISLAYSQ
jgi:cellobiose epimerase